NASMLSVLLSAGMPVESVRANIKLAISGGQNEPRDAISGTVWALLTHPAQLALVRADPDVAAPRCQVLALWRRRLRARGSRVLHVRLGQSRRELLCRARSL